MAVAILSLSFAGAQELPDFDLRIEVPPVVRANPGQVIAFPATVVLATGGEGADPSLGARAWSLSLRPQGGDIMSATTEGLGLPDGLRLEGYELTELTTGDGNAGVVSAVILSFRRDVSLPVGGEAALLRVSLAVSVEASGCRPARIEFSDGLVGSGQPVRNVITCGEGITRRDDGGALDRDEDGYENGESTVCARRRFVRGDGDADGAAGISDAVALLAFLFRGGAGLACEEAVDANNDGFLDLADAIVLLNHFFTGGPPPAAPYPLCGLDTPGRSLPCESTACP